MLNYTIRLTGVRTIDGRLPGRVLGDVVQMLADGTAGALLLRSEGRSVRSDRLANWVERGTDFTVIEQLTGSEPGVRIATQRLGDALPERFEQVDMFPQLARSESALSIFLSSLSDAAGERDDSDAFDAELLRVYNRVFSRLFTRDRVREVVIHNGIPDAIPARYTAGILKSFSALRERTPEPRRVRLAGRMDEARYSRSSFVLDLADATRTRCVLLDARQNELKEHFGESVVVEGLAQFRPSGRLLRIDVERISRSGEADRQVFSKEPVALDARLDLKVVDRLRAKSKGVSSLIGQWPGEETDEEIAALISELS